MKTRRLSTIWVLVTLLLVACADKQASPPSAAKVKEGTTAEQGEDKSGTVARTSTSASLADLPALPGELVLSDEVKDPRILQAKGSMEKREYEELLGLFEPDAAGRLSPPEQAALAEIYLRAATNLRVQLHDVPFATMFCERGLLLSPKHSGLLRLQIDNYLQPDMNLVAGAEELADRLVRVDSEDIINQYLRGRVAFEQAEYDEAVSWLQRAARPETKGTQVERAYKLLEMAKAKRDELKASLSMTRELEVMMARAKQLAKNNPGMAQADSPMVAKPGEVAEPSGGRIVLYMTKWCKYCTKTRELLKKLNVKFEEKDIERDQKALMHMMDMAQRAGVEVTGVPVTQIGNRLVVGYNPSLIESMVNKIR